MLFRSHAALENALDVPHTAFVHRGDFRGKESREIEAVRRRIPGGIEVEYLGEPPLSGPTHDAEGRAIVSEHWDRYLAPALAQVEYRTSSGRHLINTLPHTPVSELTPVFRRGLVAIVEGDEGFLGLITRMDLLNYLRRRMR